MGRIWFLYKKGKLIEIQTPLVTVYLRYMTGWTPNHAHSYIHFNVYPVIRCEVKSTNALSFMTQGHCAGTLQTHYVMCQSRRVAGLHLLVSVEKMKHES